MSLTKQHIAGRVDGLAGEGILGWACASDCPESRLWVELLVDDYALGIARAENFHADSACYGDGCYGFWLPLPPMLRESESTVSVRVANTDIFLEPFVSLKKAEQTPVSLSAVSNDMGLTLSGWIRDPDEPERKVNVTVWYKGRELSHTEANERRFRPDGSDGHGFSLSLPLELADGLEHQIDVLDDRKRPLHGSPIRVCALPEGIVAWSEGQKRLEGPQRKCVERFLRNYEKWLPKGVRVDTYDRWRECFPAPAVHLSRDTRVGLLDGRTVTAEALRDAAQKHDYLLWHDGERLHPQAVMLLLNGLRTSDAALVYADSETRSANALLPVCKSAWDIWFFLGQDSLGPLLFRSSLLSSLDIMDDTPTAVRTRLILAAHETDSIRHLPLFLSEMQTESVPDGDARRKVLQTWLNGKASVVPLDAAPHLSQVRWSLAETPLVSMLIPTRDRADLLRACLTSLDTSTYQNLEICILDNGSTNADALALLDQAAKGHVFTFPVRVLSCPGPFNYAAINNLGAQEARGEILCLLNNDTEVLSPHWLEEMLGILLHSPETASVGAVGAKLLWPNDLVQHGGVVVGTHQLAAHIGNQWMRHEPADLNRNLLARQVSAVTAACLLTPKRLFLELGGFDAVRFPVTFNDVDYCLRLRELGKRIVWTPHAQLMHCESASRGRDITRPQKMRETMEMQHFRTRWGGYDDPFYNPNLSLSTVLEPFSGLALPPRNRSFR